jgi:hypothetical protein
MSNDTNLFELPLESYKRFFSSLSSLAHEEVFKHCSRTLIFSRHHYLDYKGSKYERSTFKELLETVINNPTRDEDALEFIACLHLLSISDIGLEQVPHELTYVNVVQVIKERLRLYADHGSKTATFLLDESNIITSASELPVIRNELDTRFYRYSIIDGHLWYRREKLIPHSAIPSFQLSQVLIEKLSPYNGLRLEESESVEMHQQFVHRIVESCLQVNGESKPVVLTILEHITEDDTLGIDFATLTCPNGIELHQPQVIGQGKSSNDEIFTKTWIRSDVQIARPEMIEQIVNARMTKLKQKAVKNFYHPGPLFGKASEKSADYFISFNEDAHHKGHQMAGVSTAGRSPIFIDVKERGLNLPPSMADLRCIRMSNDIEDRFTEDLLKIVIYYANLMKLVIEATYRLNGVISKIEPKKPRGASNVKS